MLVFYVDLSLMAFQVSYVALLLLISVIDSFEWFWVGSCHKNIQLMLEFFKAPFVVLHFYLLYINDLSDDVICDICAGDKTLYSKYDQASHLWLQLELTSELESDLQDNVDRSRDSGLLISMLEKLKLYRLTGLITLKWYRLTGLITLVLLMWKWMGLVLR